MRRDAIITMPEGRDIGVLIAHEVMGWAIQSITGVPYFSTEIEAAWDVVERMMKIDSHWSPGINWDDDDGDGNPMWNASFTYYGEENNEFRCEEVWDKSAP